jgi:hypothetical protein
MGHSTILYADDDENDVLLLRRAWGKIGVRHSLQRVPNGQGGALPLWRGALRQPRAPSPSAAGREANDTTVSVQARTKSGEWRSPLRARGNRLPICSWSS